MTNQDALKSEYKELAKQYGFVPNLPTSVAQTILELERAEREGLLSPLGRDMLIRLKQVTPEEIKETDKGLDEFGYGDDFLDRIAISDRVSNSILSRVFCAEFPTGDFNACAMYSPNGYLCLINKGLRNLVFRMSMAVWTYYLWREEIDGKEKPSFEDMMKYVLEICYKYLTGQTGPAETDIKHSKGALERGAEIARSIRLFVVAHEVAHAELGHLDSGIRQAVASPVGEIDILQKSRQQEFEADALAQEILTNIAEKTQQNSDGSGGSLLVVCGGVCFLSIEMIISKCREILFKQELPHPTTHPSSKDRINALYKGLEKRISSQQLNQLRAIQSSFGNIYDTLSE